MLFLKVLETVGLLVAGAYAGSFADSKFKYSFFAFVNEYVFRIKPKGEKS